MNKDLHKLFQSVIASISENDLPQFVDYVLTNFSKFQDTELGDIGYNDLIQNGLKEIRESKFSKALYCVHCEGRNIKKNGKYRGRQRYLCRDCGRTFNDLSKSPLSGIKNIRKFVANLGLMLDQRTLRYCKSKLKINLQTAFYWRHKVLYGLRGKQSDVRLEGIVEADETYFLESKKGERGITGRKPRQRGGSAKKRGLSKEQVSVMVAIDRSGDTYCTTAGFGMTTVKKIEATIGPKLGDKAILVTDSARAFKHYSEEHSISHVRLPKGRRRQGVYHIQHVNSYHSGLKQWMVPFKGVATKYLNNYLQWFRFFHSKKGRAEHILKEEFLRDSQSSKEYMKIKDFPITPDMANVDPTAA